MPSPGRPINQETAEEFRLRRVEADADLGERSREHQHHGQTQTDEGEPQRTEAFDEAINHVSFLIELNNWPKVARRRLAAKALSWHTPTLFCQTTPKIWLVARRNDE
jgi:hypothetical protein